MKFGTASANNGGDASREVTGTDNAITLPSKIATIGQNAFAGTAATTVNLSGVTGLAEISNSVFKDMTKLTTVQLPSTVTTIGNNAFQNDANLVKLSQSSPSAQARDENEATTAAFGSKLTTIRDNAFYGTGFSTVDLSAAGTTTSGGPSSSPSTQAPSLTVGSNAFTNMANLAEVKLPANANINPTYFGNPTTAEGAPKLQTITYGTGTAIATIGDATISSSNFSKIKNETIQIKSNTQQPINFTGGVFNGNKTMTTLKLNVTQNQPNGNSSL